MTFRFWALTGLMSLLCGGTLAQPTRRPLGDGRLFYGVSYYPELWPDSCLAQDRRLMKAYGVNVVRMAEFSWSRMEPKPGRFEFAWLDRVIDSLYKEGIYTILGTPSATPPAWMWERFPRMGLVDAAGRRATLGMRRDAAYNDPDYIKASVAVATEMARRYGRHPAVIGWQIDNEFSLSYDYSERTKRGWHQWLARTYGNVGRINHLWRLDQWSQHFDRIEQIPMPDMEQWYHPSLKMAWARYHNELVVAFQQAQVVAIRRHAGQPITHDGMPNQKIDYDLLFRDLDFVAFNNYHSWEAYPLIISNYDRVRAQSGRAPYWLFETAPNYSGGGNAGSTWYLHQPKGSVRAATWMAYALGGQGVMYWPWRQQPAGQEMTHGAMLSSWGDPASNADELTQIGREVARLSPLLSSMPPAPAQTAVIYDYRSLVGLTIEKSANDLRYYQDWTDRFYLPVHEARLHRDVISTRMSLDPYRLVFAPLCARVDRETQKAWLDWVQKGGTLVLGPMSAYRDDEWTQHLDANLGHLEKATGVRTAARIPIGVNPRPKEERVRLGQFAPGFGDDSATGGLWAEAYRPGQGGTVLARYTNSALAGQAAIVRQPYGRGSIVYLGTDPGQAALKGLLSQLATELSLERTPAVGSGVLVVPRRGAEGRTGYFIINLTDKTYPLPSGLPRQDLLADPREIPATATGPLGPFQVRFLAD